MSTERIIIHDIERDCISVENTEETGEWVLAILSLAIELNKGNQELLDWLKEQSEDV